MGVVHISKLTIVIVVVAWCTPATIAFVGSLLEAATFLRCAGPLKLITDNAEKDNGLLLLQLLKKKWGRANAKKGPGEAKTETQLVNV